MKNKYFIIERKDVSSNWRGLVKDALIKQCDNSKIYEIIVYNTCSNSEWRKNKSRFPWTVDDAVIHSEFYIRPATDVEVFTNLL